MLDIEFPLKEFGLVVIGLLASTCIHEDGFVQYPLKFNLNYLLTYCLYNPGTPVKCQRNNGDLKPNCEKLGCQNGNVLIW